VVNADLSHDEARLVRADSAAAEVDGFIHEQPFSRSKVLAFR
jgi:hypothetical protein